MAPAVRSSQRCACVPKDWAPHARSTASPLPWTLVPATLATSTARITYGTDGADYSDESDRVPMPIPLGAPIEGDDLVHLVRDLESRLLGVPAGIQDYHPPVFGGLAALHLNPGAVTRHPISLPVDRLAESAMQPGVQRSHLTTLHLPRGFAGMLEFNRMGESVQDDAT